MTRTSRYNLSKLPKELKDRATAQMLTELRGVESAGDLKRFFARFFTEDERELAVRRMAVMMLLNKGSTYREIKEGLDVSKATISNVKDIIAGRGYGRNPGRKRIYSSPASRDRKRGEKIFRLKYKGARSII